MSRMIHKIEIPVTHEQVIKLPKGSKILKIDKQNDNIFMWYLVNVEEKAVDGMRVYMTGTGKQIHFNLEVAEHVETVVIGEYVWHIFIDSQHIKRFR